MPSTPRHVEIDVTNQCNQRCCYCCHFQGAGDVTHDVPAEAWLKFIEQMRLCNVISVTLSGGEPFLRADLREIIEAIVRSQMRFGIITNATLITEDMAGFLASTKRCDMIQVSIDGSTPETHEVFRGQATFSPMLKGLLFLKGNGLPVSARVTIHKHNIHSLESIAQFLLEDLGLPCFSTNAASYLGACRWSTEQIQLSIEEYCRAMADLFKLSRRYPGRIRGQAGPLANAKNWLEMNRALAAGETGMDGRGYLAGCKGIFTKIAVRADGTIVPCNQLSHIELGHVNQDGLREVWQSHPELNRLRRRCMIRLDTIQPCKNCDYVPYCTGGCPALSYTILGDEYQPNPEDCLMRFLGAGGRLPDGHRIPA